RSGDLGKLTAREAWELIAFVPLGVLAAHRPGWGWRQVLALGLVVAAGVEFLQLFVASHSCSAADVVIGALAMLAGWKVAAKLGRKAALAAWLVAAVVIAWQPFNFGDSDGGPLARLNEATGLPLEDYAQQDPLHAFDVVVHKGVLFLVLGALL